MRIYYWLISVLLLLPAFITAQISLTQENDTGALNDTANGGMNGAGTAAYGSGWWFWTLLLLAILLMIVWWAVRAGNSSKTGQKRDRV